MQQRRMEDLGDQLGIHAVSTWKHDTQTHWATHVFSLVFPRNTHWRFTVNPEALPSTWAFPGNYPENCA